MTVRVSDPFGLVELGRAFHTTVAADRHPAHGAAARDPARRRLDRVRRQPAPGLRHRQRGGRDRARVPPRRRPAPGALAQLGPRRRADGAPRGAAVAVAGDPVPRQPACARTAARASPPRSRRAVSAAASIAVHLSQRGFTVRLVTAAGEDPSSAWHTRDDRAQHRPAAGGAGRRPAGAPARSRHRLADRGRSRRAAASRCSASVDRARRPRAKPDARARRLGAGGRRSTSTPGSAPAPPARTRPRSSPAGLACGRRWVRATGSRRSGRSWRAAAPALPRRGAAVDAAPAASSDDRAVAGARRPALPLAWWSRGRAPPGLAADLAGASPGLPARRSARCSSLAAVVAGTGALGPLVAAAAAVVGLQVLARRDGWRARSSAARRCRSARPGTG